jgi:uncharacterized protein
MTFRSALYLGDVVHVRTRPKAHRLRYSVFTLLADLDELPALARGLRLLGVNRAGVLSFHEADHGAGTPGGLKAWAEATLQRHGIDAGGGPIRLLCYPRVFGYVFNPLSVYFCCGADEALRAIIYEVNNTHGERHCYVAPVAAGADVRQEAAKRMYVSPFIEMGCRYAFRLHPPDERVTVSVSTHDAAGLLLTAVFSGARRTLTDGALALMLVAYPLMTLKVIAAIHWQALKLWAKGVPYLPHRPAARREAPHPP